MNKHPGALTLILLLAAATSLSQFYRVSNSVIGPELASELGLSAREFGLAGGAFFFALMVAQIPVGMAFDRWGARLTLSAVSGLAVIGALGIAHAENATALISARFLVGLGCSASFMSAVYLCSRWFGVQRFMLVLSWVFAMSNAGTLAAATPLAWAAQTIGWRNAFVGLALLTALIAVLFFALVRDDPPGVVPAPRQRETLSQVWSGLLEVWRTPGLGPILAMHTFAYASMVTVLGVWAGPYLHDVYGLDAVTRGNVLFAMGLAQIAGALSFGPLDRIFGTRKKIVIAGALASIAIYGALGLIVQPPLELTVGLLMGIPFLSSYALLLVAQGRALFPDRIAGRGVTTVNMAQVMGATLLPALTGYLVGALSAVEGDTTIAGAISITAPESAYRAVFALLAIASLAGLLVYLRSKDSRPQG